MLKYYSTGDLKFLLGKNCLRYPRYCFAKQI